MPIAIGIGIGPTFGGNAAGGGGGPVSAITSLTIVSASPLLDQTNDYGDATARIGVNGNGWVAKVVLPDDGTSTFDPSKITLTVTDPGYDGSGTTTVTRTIVGTAILRRQYAQNTARMNAASAGARTLFFALSDDIYQGSTVTAAQAASGFYGPAAAGAISTVTNSSTLAYEKPLVAFMNTPHERATTDYPVELVAIHRRGQQGRMVARVEFIAKDAHSNTAATQTASSTSLSALQTQGNIAEVYKATIPVTSLTQGDICEVGVKVYPWLGDSSAILDLTGSDNITWPTIQPQTRLRFKLDKTGVYGGAFAYVCAANPTGNDGTGVISLTAATARAIPFATIEGALNALQAWNNSNRTGNNTLSGAKVRLRDNAGANQAYAIGASLTGAAGDCWTDVEPDPLNTGVASLTLATTRSHNGMIRWKANLAVTADSFLNGGIDNGNVMISFDSCTTTYSVNPAAPLNYKCGLGYYRNWTLSGMAQPECHPWNGFSTSRIQATAIGCIVTDATLASWQARPTTFIGNTFKRGFFSEVDLAAAPQMDSQDGAVIYNNQMQRVTAVSEFGKAQVYARGLALVQNVWERAATVTVGALNVGGDGTLLTMGNVVELYQSVPGITTNAVEFRTNRCYANVAGTEGIIKRMDSRFNLWFEFNQKRDTFTNGGALTSTGRVGGWRYGYGVAMDGNCCVTGSANPDTTTDPDGGTIPPGNWIGEFWPASCSVNAGAANVTWTTNKCGSGDVGGGVYSLTGATNSAYDRVGSGKAALAFDIAGVARKNDGHGAAGAYERTV